MYCLFPHLRLRLLKVAAECLLRKNHHIQKADFSISRASSPFSCFSMSFPYTTHCNKCKHLALLTFQASTLQWHNLSVRTADCLTDVLVTMKSFLAKHLNAIRLNKNISKVKRSYAIKWDAKLMSTYYYFFEASRKRENKAIFIRHSAVQHSQEIR